MSLNFGCNSQIGSSEFHINNRKASIVICISGSGCCWWCNGDIELLPTYMGYLSTSKMVSTGGQHTAFGTLDAYTSSFEGLAKNHCLASG